MRSAPPLHAQQCFWPKHETAANKAGNLTLTTGAIVSDNRIHRILDIGLLVQSAEFQTITEQA